MAAQTGKSETVRALAHLLSQIDAAILTPAALRQAQLLLLDTIGCGLAGMHEETPQTVAKIAIDSGDRPECALIGRAEKTGMLNAVLVNGVAVRALDFNDYFIGESAGQPEAGGHPSDNIPVALAVGAVHGADGGAILESIVIGYELYARLQHLMNRAGPWDGVTVSGLVAAAMAGRLMQLNEERLAHALALGATRAATPTIVRSGDFSAAKSIANALVAQASVQAALLAKGGLSGPLAILDDARGLRDLFANAELSSLLAPFPAESAILRAHVKTYPCVNTAQSAVAAALKLHAMVKGEVENLNRIEIVMADYPVVKRQQEDEGRIRPVSREAADHSFPFLVAVSLIDGRFGIAQYENERWQDARVKALMAKIATRRDAGWNGHAPGVYPCTIHAAASDGREFTAEVPYPPGFSGNGLDANTVIEKFHAITEAVLARKARERLVDAIMEFHHSPSTATLDAAMTKGGI